MTPNLLISFVQSSIVSGTLLLLGALGYLLCAKAGMLNLGIEGLMLMGAVIAFSVGSSTSSPWLGLLVAMATAAMLGLLFAVVCISLQAHQVIAGLAIVIFGTGLSGFLGKPLMGIVSDAIFQPIQIPLLSDLPWIGPSLFQYDLIVYISFLSVPLITYFLRHTHPGLRLRAVGENPLAAETMGVNVIGLRYLYTMIGSALAGAGGAFLTLSHSPTWVENMTVGRGWISIAMVIFARYSPLRTLVGCVIFGAVEAFALRAQVAGIMVPTFYLNILPYVLTFTVLLMTARSKRGKIEPEALAQPYYKEAR